METKELILEIDNIEFTLYAGKHIVGYGHSKGDEEWKERCDDVLHLAKMAKATVKDNRK